MKNTKNNFIDSIGNTPLIKLKAASEITGCNIYGKAEFLNPGGSVKDRTALGIILDAEKNNLLKAPETYMEKISTKVNEKHLVDLDKVYILLDLWLMPLLDFVHL